LHAAFKLFSRTLPIGSHVVPVRFQQVDIFPNLFMNCACSCHSALWSGASLLLSAHITFWISSRLSG
jgi:hypothetical protein